ncbi:TonB-dependent receptor domain-containing protein [Caulobacter sp. X]|uniref:TonB-dependent receptor domain-containing protein n=1 Tax=Caulobacter sp. X TaxID=2048901 RepID=UPI000C15A0FB|nr:TonB-dependent receptor [Caulobacter sp. X]PIB96747.1 TonB-dependent receptor [Caulobacter sp. X]
MLKIQYLGGASALVLLLNAAPVVAHAQTDTGASATAVEEIVVTGSRIARRDYSSDSPIVTVGKADIEKLGSVTVDTILNQMPQFVPSVSSTSNNPSNGGQANIDLRGLGTARTMILMDGHRVVPSNSDGTVDVNIIPAALIQNIEVISGGASATYGSDALAGVVNFKLNNNFTGLQLDAQYGVTEEGDGREKSLALTAGGKYAEDRGHAVFSLSYSERGQVYNAARDFSKISGASSTTPYGRYDATGTNLPSQAAINAVFAKYGIAAGTVKASANLGFNDDGTLFYNGVNYKGSTAIDYSTIPVNGTYNTGALNLLQLPLKRYNAYAATDYQINEHAQFYGSFNFTHYDSTTVLAPAPAASSTGFSVPVTNPFIPADLATLLASRANPNASFLLRKRFTDVGPRVSDTTFNVFQIAGGVRGDIGFKDWTYDVFASYGRSEQNETQSGNISHSAVQTLLNASDGGASLCEGGYDPFGLNALSAACRSYISRQTKNRTVAEQQVVEANLQGGLFDLPAGEVRAAIGASYKRDTYLFEPDSLLSTGDVVGFNAQDAIDASTNVKELYGELLVPVLKDLPFIKALDLNVGYRLSDYNTVGDVNAYKLDGDWEVVEGFRIRGGYQRAVRAPSIGELYSPQNQGYPSITEDPCAYNSTYRAGSNASTVRALCLAQGVPSAIIDSYTYANTQVNALSGGNPDLRQETANTYSVGAVWTPRIDHPLLERLSLSVDYYSIDIKNAIGTIDAATALDKCYSAEGNPTGSTSNYYCSLFKRNSETGEIDTLTLTNLNLAEYKTTGVDFQVDWGFGLGAVGLDDRYGAIKVNVIGTYLDSFKVQSLPGEDFIELKGTIGNTQISSTAVSHPEWKYNTSVSYLIGPVEIGARWRYIGNMVDAADASEKIGAVNYYDLNASWKVNDTYSIRGGVTNLTNKQPPYFSSYVQANTDPSTYDVLGRRFFVAVKAKF